MQDCPVEGRGGRSTDTPTRTRCRKENPKEDAGPCGATGKREVRAVESTAGMSRPTAQSHAVVAAPQPHPRPSLSPAAGGISLAAARETLHCYRRWHRRRHRRPCRHRRSSGWRATLFSGPCTIQSVSASMGSIEFTDSGPHARDALLLPRSSFLVPPLEIRHVGDPRGRGFLLLVRRRGRALAATARRFALSLPVFPHAFRRSARMRRLLPVGSGA